MLDANPPGAEITGRVLVAEDEPSMRDALARLLRSRGCDVTVAEDGTQAILALDRDRFDLVVADLRMPGVDGLAVLRRAREIAPQTLVLLTTAHASLDTAVQALREGVADYVPKPIALGELVTRVCRMLELRDHLQTGQAQRRRVHSQTDVVPFVGRSPAVRRLMALMAQVAPTDSTVLISGESGVGKEVAAEAIHRLSHLRDKLFLPLNCGAIPEPLLESQLFGHAKGAFTGADSAYEGMFRRARGGTIFLDEIGEMAAGLQVKLLRAIEQKEILPIGTTTPIRVRVRILASTNRDLRQEVDRGRFREDLYYRLNVVCLEIPPLRDRPEDIPPLVEHLVRRQNARLRRSYKGVSNDAMARLVAMPWKGNVRELDHAIEYAMIVGDGKWIERGDLPPQGSNGFSNGIPSAPEPECRDLASAVRWFEKRHIETVLQRLENDRRAAAAELGIHLATLYRKIQDLQIKPIP